MMPTVEQVRELIEERDEWRDRASKAESRLASMEIMLAGAEERARLLLAAKEEWREKAERRDGYVLELEPWVWTAPGVGEPARTSVLHQAMRYGRRDRALAALARARAYGPYPNARIVPIAEIPESDVQAYKGTR